ncbi:MAG: ABC transporter ATP-binding protein [Lachnospiraceae bacterium]|nr:ABC transporter ATP-binding protein [Lachnospiraceae bacterium]
MRIIRKLIRSHKILFLTASIFTILSVLLNLYWNRFLADVIDRLGSVLPAGFQDAETVIMQLLMTAAFIILFHTVIEFSASYMASYTCEVFAHEMRMGYSRFYLQSDILTLSKCNVGEEQSAMQNELREISAYLNENLFSFMKQFAAFAVTGIFLFCQSGKLTLFTLFPVIPLLLYCYFSGKIIKNLTEQCQKNKAKMNGLTGILLELFPVIQVYHAHELIQGSMNEKISEWQNRNIRKERITARLMSFSGLLSFVPLLLLLGFGGRMVISGEISMGIFYIFINLSGDVSGFLQNMPGIYAGFRRFCASVSRLEGRL